MCLTILCRNLRGISHFVNRLLWLDGWFVLHTRMDNAFRRISRKLSYKNKHKWNLFLKFASSKHSCYTAASICGINKSNFRDFSLHSLLDSSWTFSRWSVLIYSQIRICTFKGQQPEFLGNSYTDCTETVFPASTVTSERSEQSNMS
jgi:hypothetical protein